MNSRWSQFSPVERSGWYLSLGLLICLPTFTWWGMTIQIHPVHRVVMDDQGQWHFPPDSRWKLPLEEAQDWRASEGPWKKIGQTSALAQKDETVTFRWQPISLWRMIRLELIP